MPVPKKRTSRSRRNKRRAHHSIRKEWGVVCPRCGDFKLSHTVCMNCGFYNSQKQVLAIEEKTEKKKG